MNIYVGKGYMGFWVQKKKKTIFDAGGSTVGAFMR
jgi:hypothetical protein